MLGDARSLGGERGDGSHELREIVMGLHWDPPPAGVTADLDALCVLFDPSGRNLEVIHPGHPRGADGSVVHTGDSRNGASAWDDERIFVFLDALPKAVHEFAFVVLSASGQSFDEVPGALCHVSDASSESALVRVELTSVAGRTEHLVASAHREASGWRIAAGGPALPAGLIAALRRQIGDGKRSATGRSRSPRGPSRSDR